MEAMTPPINGVRMDTTCEVHRHRELVPIEVHHVHPLGQGGLNVAGNRITVCANGHFSIHALMDRLLKGNGVVAWTTRRRYGKKVRAYAQRGYEEIVAGR
jgi:hypothetical protein